MNANFVEFFAPFWKISPDRKFKVLGFSRSGYSAYLSINGKKRLVPTAVLLVH
jgi:hypothetical protein